MRIFLMIILLSIPCLALDDYKSFINNKGEIDPVYLDNAIRDLYSEKLNTRGDMAGILINSKQPSFLVYNSNTDASVTGDGTEYTIAYDIEVRDKNANFASNTFTAPITGVYHFDTSVNINGLSQPNHENIYLRIKTSNRTYCFFDMHTATTTQKSYSLSVDADMDINDTATVTIQIDGSNKNVGVYGDSTLYTFWSGSLIN